MQAERSGLVPTLVGGVIGAAVGVGLQVVLEAGLLGQRFEASWCAVLIGVLVGIGVRQANRHHMERSYLRGAVSGLIALAAIVASSFAIKEVMSRREATPLSGPKAAAARAEMEDEDKDGGDVAADDSAQAPTVARPTAPAGSVGAPLRGLSSEPNWWQFVFMALGGFFAYELGRGADPRKGAATVAADDAEPLVGGTDPSN